MSEKVIGPDEWPPTSSSPGPRLANATLISTFGIVAAAAIALCGAVVLARLLNPDGRGSFATYTVVAVLLGIAAELGGDVGIIRAHADLGPERASIYALRYIVLIVSVSLVAALLLPIVGPALFEQCPSRLAWGLAGLGVWFALVLRLQSGQLISANRFWSMATVRILAAGTTALGALLAAVSAQRHLTGSEAASGVFLAQGALALVLTGLSVRRAVQAVSVATALQRDRLIWTNENVNLHILNNSTYFLSRGDQLALSFAQQPATLGIYAVAVNISEVVGYIPSALAPLLAAGSRDGRPSRRTWLAVITAVIGIAVVLALLTPVIVDLLFGARYHASTRAAWVLIPASAAFAIGRLAQSVALKNPAKRRPLIVGAATSGAVQFTLVLAFAGRGATSVAICCAIAYLVYLATAAATYRGQPRASV